MSRMELVTSTLLTEPTLQPCTVANTVVKNGDHGKEQEVWGGDQMSKEVPGEVETEVRSQQSC